MRHVATLVLCATSAGCVLDADRFHLDYRAAFEEMHLLCEGPSGDIGRADLDVDFRAACVFDAGPARACLRAMRALDEEDCVDPELEPGRFPVPSECAPAEIYGCSVNNDVSPL